MRWKGVSELLHFCYRLCKVHLHGRCSLSTLGTAFKVPANRVAGSRSTNRSRDISVMPGEARTSSRSALPVKPQLVSPAIFPETPDGRFSVELPLFFFAAACVCVASSLATKYKGRGGRRVGEGCAVRKRKVEGQKGNSVKKIKEIKY